MIREPDANTAALNAYLRKIDEADAREAAIEARTLELLADEYNPMTYAAISEAIPEATATLREVIEAACERYSPEALGAAVKAAAERYWLALARSKAEDEVDNDWRSCSCHGRGCRRCHEPEDYHERT